MISVKRLYELEKKFKRYSSWSGADGVFTNVYKDSILWYFSDTFIGDSDEFDQRINFTLINNSLAISDIKVNDVSFYYNQSPLSSAIKEEDDNTYFWLEDSYLSNDSLFIYGLNMKNDIFSNEIFQIKGISLIELQLPFDKRIKYKITPLNLISTKVILGTSIIKKGRYFYIYGYIDEPNNKKLVISRAKDLRLCDLEYLHEDYSWKKDSDNLMILKDHFSSEFKVVFLDGYYYIAYSKNSIGNEIYLIRTKQLVKKYNDELLLYKCPEHQGNIIAYNAKIQKALSNKRKLVISYNVNTLVNEEHKNLDIYRPRFIEVSMEDIKNEFEKKQK